MRRSSIHGLKWPSSGTSIAASYNTATGVLTLSGSDTLAHYQQVLDNVTYSSTAADPTGAGTKFTRTISWSASDSGSTGTAVTTSVGVRTPPVVTPGSPSVTFTAGGGAVPLDTVLTLTDAETGTLTGGLNFGKDFPVPIGSFVSSNLTPAGQLSHWSDGDIFRARHLHWS